MSRALDFFRKSTAQNATATSPAASCSEVVQSGAQNSPEFSHARLKSSPSYPSYPEPRLVLAPSSSADVLQAPSSARPGPEPKSPVSGNSGNSGNFLAGSAPRKRNIAPAVAPASHDGDHKEAIDALKRLKNVGASVTWDGHESHVSFDVTSGEDQASIQSYAETETQVDAYLAAELPEFTPAEQAQQGCSVL